MPIFDHHIRVSCAIIERDGLVLAAQRSPGMSMALKWEFPGGKIKEGESPAGCLRRELLEELGVDAEVGRALPLVIHRYPDFKITLHPFLCTISPSAKIMLQEHYQATWIPPEKLDDIDWAAADVGVVKNYLEFRGHSGKGSRSARSIPLAVDMKR